MSQAISSSEPVQNTSPSRNGWAFLIVLWGCVATLSATCLMGQNLTRGPYLQLGESGGQTGMIVAWFTDRESSSAVEVVDGKGTVTRFEQKAPVIHHIVEADGLIPGTRYKYKVYSGSRLLAGDGEFTTLSYDDSGVRFLALGDSGTGDTRQVELARRIDNVEVDFGLHTGDVVYPDGEDENYPASFFRPYAKTLLRVPFVATIGNHDARTDEAGPMLSNFVLPEGILGDPLLRPEENFSFDAGNVHVAVINSVRLDKHAERFQTVVVPWLRRDLAASTKPWKIVCWHYPPYSDDNYHGDDPQVQELLVPVLEETGVNFGFFGHSHNFQRFKPMKDGKTVPSNTAGSVVYIVSGAGGASLYSLDRSDRLSASSAGDRSFSYVEVVGQEFNFHQINRLGEEIDNAVFKQKEVAQADFGIAARGAAFFHLERKAAEYGYPLFQDQAQDGIGGLEWIRYRPSDGLGSSIPVGSQRAKKTQWIFVEWAPGVVTSLAVSNPGAAAASVSFTAYSSKGAVAAQSSRAIGPGDQITLSVPALLPDLKLPFSGTIRVASSKAVGVYTVRSLITAKGVRLASIAPFSAGDRAESLVFFPTDPAFSSRIILANPDSAEAAGILRFRRGDRQWSTPYTVAPRGVAEVSSSVVKENGNWFVEASPARGRVPEIIGLWRVHRQPGDYFEATLNGRVPASRWQYPIEETPQQKLSFGIANGNAEPIEVQLTLRDRAGNRIDSRVVQLEAFEIEGSYLRSFFPGMGSFFQGTLEIWSNAEFLAEGFLTSLERGAFTVAAFAPMESGGSGFTLLYPLTVFNGELFRTDLWIQNEGSDWTDESISFRLPTGSPMFLYQRY